MVTFTCQVIRSITIQWDSPLIRQIVFSAGSTVSTSRPPFIASLTSIAGIGVNSNITSTLQVNASRTFRRSDTTVECRNQLSVTEESRFTVAGNNDEYCQTIEIPDTQKTCYKLGERTQISFYGIHILTLKYCAFFGAFRVGFKISNLDAHRTLSPVLLIYLNFRVQCFIVKFGQNELHPHRRSQS